MQSSTPTLARRYIFKLVANIASVPVYLAMEAILPRALGPQMYGNYSFATNLFQQLSGFLDMGTSTCFYNSLSRRQSETGLIGFYMRVTAAVFAIILLAAALLQFPFAGELLMPDVPLWLAPLAAMWAFLTWWGARAALHERRRWRDGFVRDGAHSGFAVHGWPAWRYVLGRLAEHTHPVLPSSILCWGPRHWATGW